MIIGTLRYQLQTTSSFTEQWCSYLTSLEVPAEPIFYQHFTGIIFDNLIKLNIPAVENKDIDVNLLTFEEENAIHYVGGYVLKSLKDVERNEEILHGISYLINNTRESNKSDSGSDVWIKEMTNIITEEARAHQVFLSIELAIRTYLRTDNLCQHNETSRKTVENMLFSY